MPHRCVYFEILINTVSDFEILINTVSDDIWQESIDDRHGADFTSSKTH